MPRNSGTGVYSPPPNITAVSGAPIESADWNAKIQDDTTMFNSPVPIGLGGTGVTSLTGFLATLGGLPLAGGKMTGPITLSGDAVAALQPVTQQQVTAALNTKANASHTHSASTITNFSAAVSSSLGEISINALSDVVSISPVSGHVLIYNGTNYVNRLAYAEGNLGVLSGLGSGAGKKTYNHGLGVRPSSVVVCARCKTAYSSFVVGDEVQLNNALTNSVSFGSAWYWNDTSVFVSGYGGYYAIYPDGSNAPLNNANFDLVVRAFI